MAALALALPIAQIVIPLITTAITLVENLIGKGNGPEKLKTVVGFLQTALTGLANAGKIPSAPVVDPNLPAALTQAVQKVFDQVSVNGTIPGSVTNPIPTTPSGVPQGSPGASQVTRTPAVSLVTGNGRSYLVLEVT